MTAHTIRLFFPERHCIRQKMFRLRHCPSGRRLERALRSPR